MPKTNAAAVIDAPPLQDDPRDAVEMFSLPGVESVEEVAKRTFVDSMMEPDDDEVDPAVAAANLGRMLAEDGATGSITTPDGSTFELEPPIEPGKVPKRVVEELCSCYRIAADYAGSFADAIKAQAEKHKIHPKALRRYVVALEGGKTGEARKELDDLERLLDGAGIVDATITITKP